MHFPTLPKKWRLISGSLSHLEASHKPPKCEANRKLSLHRSASFSSEDMNFKVPSQPLKTLRPRRPSAVKKAKNNGHNTDGLCVQCSAEKQWKSQSLVDLNNKQKVQPQPKAASIFSNNLRSNSWRNLSYIGQESIGGMNRSHRLSQGAKKVNPPLIPPFNNPRGSGSSFGSDFSYEREQHHQDHHQNNQPMMSTFAKPPANHNGEHFNNQSSPAFTKLTFEADVLPTNSRGIQNHIPKDMKSNENKATPAAASVQNGAHSNGSPGIDQDQGIDLAMSPGRDSPGDESSIATVESVSSGCRNSTTSLDSGRASNSNSESNGLISASNNFHTIHEHRPMVTIPPQPPRLSSLGTSFRQSYHSSTSSLGSMERAHEDSICALDITEMVANGVPDLDILLAWLTDLHFEDYYDLFASAGYDMPTISKMTPEDLTAIGIKKPNHRKKIKAEIVKLNIPDGLPNYIPPTLEEFLHLVRLYEYQGLLASQGYLSIDDLVQISIEDLEDIGIYRLGHQKRLLLAIKRAKDLKSGRRIAQFPNMASSRKPPMSSFHHQQPPMPPMPPSRAKSTGVDHYRSMVYQPEIIRIERAPSVTSIVRPASATPSPPPPPIELLQGMPQPMPQLTTSFQRYHPSFQYPQPPSWVVSNNTRSYDDVDIALNNRNPILVHQHSASNLTASGGTLPRLGKGYGGKQRPVAKIVAKTREQQQTEHSSNPALSDADPKSQALKHTSSQSINSCGDGESFPFAQDNVGTIRMRSNSHVQAMDNEPASPQLKEDSSQNQARKLSTDGSQRTAGDVLNDIGSMLADLTDELDAMLHMERDPKNC